MSELLGLTWDHPRGYAALERAAARAAETGLKLRWQRQPLKGFESHPIEELARRYDLIVLDHPHIGDAVQTQCLHPIESIFDAGLLSRWRAQSIGRTFESYRYAGQHWALPLDAAAQVAVVRKDKLNAMPPRSWCDVIALARRERVCLSLAGPHAVLSLFSMSSAYGDVAAGCLDGRLFEGQGATCAWELMRELHALAFNGWIDKNPIEILDAMSRSTDSGDPIYCPLVYGYVNYAVAAVGAHPLHFVDAPAGPDGRLGSTLGGAGLAISRRANVDDLLRAHLTELMSEEVQTELIPFADGQPAASAAWADVSVNAAWNGFFVQTQRTLESAIVRPRFPGYISFQTAASALIRNALIDGLHAPPLIAALENLYANHLPIYSEV